MARIYINRSDERQARMSVRRLMKSYGLSGAIEGSTAIQFKSLMDLTTKSVLVQARGFSSGTINERNLASAVVRVFGEMGNDYR